MDLAILHLIRHAGCVHQPIEVVRVAEIVCVVEHVGHLVCVAAIHCVHHVRIVLIGGYRGRGSGHGTIVGAIVQMCAQGVQRGHVAVGEQTIQNGVLLVLLALLLGRSPSRKLIYVTVHVVRIRLSRRHAVDEVNESGCLVDAGTAGLRQLLR